MGEHSAPRKENTGAIMGMAKLLMRHQNALQLLAADRPFVIFMETGGLRVTPQLQATTKQWKSSREAGACSCSLRQALLGSVFMELEARLVKPELDTSAQTRLIAKGVLLKDPLRWVYVKWGPAQKTQTPTQSTLPHTDVVQGVRLLKEQLVKPEVAHKFHSIGSLASKPQHSSSRLVTHSCSALNMSCPAGPVSSADCATARHPKCTKESASLSCSLPLVSALMESALDKVKAMWKMGSPMTAEVPIPESEDELMPHKAQRNEGGKRQREPECEEKANIRIALKALTDARIRPEHSHRPLPQAKQQSQTRPSAAKRLPLYSQWRRGILGWLRGRGQLQMTVRAEFHDYRSP